MPIDYEQRRRQRAEVQGVQRESARRAESAKQSPLKSSGAARAQAPAPSMKKAAPDPTFDAPSAPLTASDLPTGTPRTKKREFGPGDV